MWVRTSCYSTRVRRIQCDQVFRQGRGCWNANHYKMWKFSVWLSSDCDQCLRWMYACWLDSVLSKEIHLPLDKFLWASRSLKWDSRKEHIFGTQFVELFCTEHERYEHKCQFLHQRLGHEEASPRFIYPVLDRGYKLWNITIVSTLSFRGREETLAQFPLDENSKSCPRPSLRSSSSGQRSS